MDPPLQNQENSEKNMSGPKGRLSCKNERISLRIFPRKIWRRVTLLPSPFEIWILKSQIFIGIFIDVLSCTEVFQDYN